MNISSDILILAPHPDDEVLLTGGIISRAIKQGTRVSVAVVTNGDYLCKTHEKGVRRLTESYAALRFLGIPQSDIYFLGYPDTGMEKEVSFINSLYFEKDENRVYPSECDTKTYALENGEVPDYCFARTGVHAPYTRNAFAADISALMLQVKPQLVITTSEYDTHYDHSALALFAKEIIRRLHTEDESFSPIMWEGLVHSPAGDAVWPQPTLQMTEFSMPPNLESTTPLKWNERICVPLPQEMCAELSKESKKHKAIAVFDTAFRPGEESVWNYLYAFAKKDEIFWETKW